MSKFPTALVTLVVVAALLEGCNLPSLKQNTAATETAAALTVAAALTSAAPAATATFTAVPFPTLPPATATVPGATSTPAVTATSNCDVASFITDVTYPDGTLADAGSAFTKTWRFKNIGSCSWTTSYALVFKSGDAMGGPAVQALTGNVNPSQTVDVSVDLTAPAGSGTYTGNWSLRNAAGVIFFTGFYVQIKVGGAGPFAVTSVTYSLSTSSSGANLNCPTVVAHIATNGAGDVQFRWTRSDGAGSAAESLHFASASTQDVHEVWLLPTAAGSATRWIGIYIDSPNHQDFGHQEFDTTCSAP